MLILAIIRKEVHLMTTFYETPAIASLGLFQEETGEAIGPHTEAILPFEDHSQE